MYTGYVWQILSYSCKGLKVGLVLITKARYIKRSDFIFPMSADASCENRSGQNRSPKRLMYEFCHILLTFMVLINMLSARR